MPTPNTTALRGTPIADQDHNTLDSGAVTAIVISALIVLAGVIVAYWYIVRRKQPRQVTLTMRRAQRIKRLDALHIDVEYSNTILDSPTTDRLSEGYSNLCSDISLDQELQIETVGSSQSEKPQNTDITDSNKITERDAIISDSLTEVDKSLTTEKCFTEEQSDEEIKPVPPERFDFDSQSTNSSREIKLTLAVLKNEEITVEHLESNDGNPGIDFSVRERNSDKEESIELDNDRESLIVRQHVTSFENQGLKVTD